MWPLLRLHSDKTLRSIERHLSLLLHFVHAILLAAVRPMGHGNVRGQGSSLTSHTNGAIGFWVGVIVWVVSRPGCYLE